VSFDLAVWYQRREPSAKVARRKYNLLAWGVEALFTSSPRVVDFYEDLLARFPALEDDPPHRQAVWAVSPKRSRRALILCIAWSRAEDVGYFVQSLAARHGLVCYDPQCEAVLTGLPSQRMIRLVSRDGSQLVRSSPDDAARTAGEVLGAGGYVRVTNESDQWIQVTRHEAVGRPPREFVVHIGAGGATGVRRFDTRDMDEVIAAIAGFARDRGTDKGADPTMGGN